MPQPTTSGHDKRGEVFGALEQDSGGACSFGCRHARSRRAKTRPTTCRMADAHTLEIRSRACSVARWHPEDAGGAETHAAEPGYGSEERKEAQLSLHVRGRLWPAVRPAAASAGLAPQPLSMAARADSPRMPRPGWSSREHTQRARPGCGLRSRLDRRERTSQSF